MGFTDGKGKFHPTDNNKKRINFDRLTTSATHKAIKAGNKRYDLEMRKRFPHQFELFTPTHHAPNYQCRKCAVKGFTDPNCTDCKGMNRN